jgi:hypothetical protein
MKAILDYIKTEIKEYNENRIKERIAEQERLTTESINNEIARQKYVSELITQANVNVMQINVKISHLTSIKAKLPNSSRGKNKTIKESLDREITWLKGKLIEEKFYAEHFKTLR